MRAFFVLAVCALLGGCALDPAELGQRLADLGLSKEQVAAVSKAAAESMRLDWTEIGWILAAQVAGYFGIQLRRNSTRSTELAARDADLEVLRAELAAVRKQLSPAISAQPTQAFPAARP